MLAIPKHLDQKRSHTGSYVARDSFSGPPVCGNINGPPVYNNVNGPPVCDYALNSTAAMNNSPTTRNALKRSRISTSSEYLLPDAYITAKIMGIKAAPGRNIDRRLFEESYRRNCQNRWSGISAVSSSTCSLATLCSEADNLISNPPYCGNQKVFQLKNFRDRSSSVPITCTNSSFATSFPSTVDSFLKQKQSKLPQRLSRNSKKVRNDLHSRHTQTESSGIQIQELESEHTIPMLTAGSVCFSDCSLSFEPGALLGPMEVKLCCRYLPQIVSTEKILVSPEVNCSFDEEKLQFPFTFTLPTCFVCSDIEKPPRIDINQLDASGSWKKFTTSPLKRSLNVMFTASATGSYQCVVVASEYPKLSKSFLIRGFLKRSKDESDHEIIVCVVDDWPHLELRMSQELSPSTEYENILDENAFIRYNQGITISVSGSDNAIKPACHEIPGEDVWQSFFYKKLLFKVKQTNKANAVLLLSAEPKQMEGLLHVDLIVSWSGESSKKLSKRKLTLSSFGFGHKISEPDLISTSSCCTTVSSANIDYSPPHDSAKQKFSLKRTLKNSFRKKSKK